MCCMLPSGGEDQELCYRKGLVDEPPEGNGPAGAPAWNKRESKRESKNSADLRKLSLSEKPILISVTAFWERNACLPQMGYWTCQGQLWAAQMVWSRACSDRRLGIQGLGEDKRKRGLNLFGTALSSTLQSQYFPFILLQHLYHHAIKIRP